MLNKKSQVSDTLTWIVATLIIVVILIIFIYFSVVLSKAKNIDVKIRKVNLDDGGGEKVDWLEEKTLLAYKINNNNREIIGGWINEKEG